MRPRNLESTPPKRTTENSLIANYALTLKLSIFSFWYFPYIFAQEESKKKIVPWFPLCSRFGPGFMGSHRSWVAQCLDCDCIDQIPLEELLTILVSHF